MVAERWIDVSEGEQSTAHADRAVAALAARQHGVLSMADLVACGLKPKAISVRAKNARLFMLHRGVYAVGHDNLSLEGCYLAAVKACGDGAVLCRWSAAILMKIIEWEDRHPDVLVLGESAPQHPEINGHRTNYLPTTHVRRVRGIPVTSAERTLLDLAAEMSERRLRRAVRQAQFLKLTTVRSLVAALHGPGPRRGRKKLARVLGTNAAPTQSELEDIVLDMLLRGGFAHPSVNEPLFLDGRRVVPDMRWARERLVIECDGAHHDDPFERAADKERQGILEAHGYRVIRVNWRQAVADPGGTLRRCTDAGAPRAVDCCA